MEADILIDMSLNLRISDIDLKQQSLTNSQAFEAPVDSSYRTQDSKLSYRLLKPFSVHLWPSSLLTPNGRH